MRLATGLVLAFACSAALAAYPAQRTLSFEDRVRAQAAIARVYYSHQLGATKSFDEAMPKAVLERKVRQYLDQTAALNVFWKTTVTDEALGRELLRMAQGTRMPERLNELYAALGNDPFLIKECLARPTLVDRLTRNFYALDSRLHIKSREQIEQLHRRLVSGELRPSTESVSRTVSELVKSETVSGSAPNDKPSEKRLTPEESQKRRAGLPARVGQVSEVVESPDAYTFDVILRETTTEVRVANYVIPKTTWDEWWATSRLALRGETVTAVATNRGPLTKPTAPFAAGSPTCSADDTWDNGVLDDLPDPGSTAVWTGNVMLVWGGTPNRASFAPGRGGRYDPATDTWAPTSTTGAPRARTGHTTVWTGSEMIVWGGELGRSHGDSHPATDGGRYDPSTDSWAPISSANVLSGRVAATAVWTGNMMIVWGGRDRFNECTDTGGRYDPATNTWMPVSTVGAPGERCGTTSVWTGSLMVVWGGLVFSDPPNSGGRYDPATDSWTPTSTTGAPSGREGQTATWTGTEMLVWGGTDGSSNSNLPGARYDPASDSWKSISPTNAPSARQRHSAVWTGSRMVVWGGFGNGGPSGELDTGGEYDPTADSWTPTSTTGAPTGRQRHAAVWTGTLMIVWGGGYNTGGRYDPASDLWTPTSTAGTPAARSDHTAVWTGSEMVVWGGYGVNLANPINIGGRYDPATDSWTPTSTLGAPTARAEHSAVWTGDLMLVWGGNVGSYPYSPTDTGGRYDVATDSWMPTSTAAAPSARSGHTAVWTGTLMLVWGGADPDGVIGTGGRYDSATDAWTPIANKDAPSERQSHTAVWTGESMIVWGGGHDSGGRYDPAADSWIPTAITDAPSPRYDHTAVWTGSRMLIWGGERSTDIVVPGGSYDPATDSWSPMSTTNAPSSRERHTAVWTGDVMVIWGGHFSSYLNDIDGYVSTGGRYDPATDSWLRTSSTGAPFPRADHTAVWTGSVMLVWGGFGTGYFSSGGRYVVAPDGDGDGYTECQGDCNDSDPLVHPGATETCNGIDDDCDGTVDNGDDALCDDGNACTVGDTCSGGVCVSGIPRVCNALDQCHTAGVCDPATGACSDPSKPDGTVCDDANLCTAGETCQSGTCTPAFDGLNHPAPKSSGYYKKLCEKRRHNQLPYQGDQLTDADAACVGDLTSTFAGISTIDDICDVIDQNQHGGRHHGGPGNGPNGKECDKGEDELIATALNICRARVCEEQQLDSNCNGNAHTTVSQSFGDADAILDDAARTKDTCKNATCELREINNGHALEMNSLLLTKESNNVRLAWSSPVLDDGSGAPSSYEVWRRPMGSNDAFLKIGTTAGVTFLDSAAATAAWEYDVTAVFSGN